MLSNRARARLFREICKPLSLADRAGEVYIDELTGTTSFKIGRTSNLSRRRREWKRQYPSYPRRWLAHYKTRHSHRLGELPSFALLRLLTSGLIERLIHICVIDMCRNRPRNKCRDCELRLHFVEYILISAGGRRHMEVFEFWKPVDFFDVILPIVLWCGDVVAKL